mgnify:CR=1 FL=1
MSIESNLRQLRLNCGMTQEQAAERLGVNAQTVSRWECGTTLPDALMLPEIARLYGVTVDDFYKKNSVGYENYAQRLCSVFEATLQSEHPEITQVCLGEISVMTEALLAGKVDAFAYDNCFQYQAENEKLPITHLEDYSVRLEYGFMFAENEKGNTLRDEFNEFVRAQSASGGLAKLQNEWLRSGEMKAIEEPINSWPCDRGEINAVSSAQGAPFSYDTVVQYIINRTGAGLCPMEETVKDIRDEKTALEALKRKVEELRANK